jgi:hypothetical protein
MRRAEENLDARPDPEEKQGGSHSNPKVQIQKKSPSDIVHAENIISFPR